MMRHGSRQTADEVGELQFQLKAVVEIPLQIFRRDKSDGRVDDLRTTRQCEMEAQTMSPDTHSCTDELIFTARFLEGLLGFIHGAVENDQPLPMRHILFAIGAEHEPCRGRESPCSRTRELWSPGEEVDAHCPRISFEAISKVGDR
jgi:hypothetical protein